MFTRIFAVVLVAMLSAPALADELVLKPGHVVTVEDAAALDSLKFEHNLYRGEADGIYSQFDNFDKQCGTQAQFRTPACFGRFKAIITALRNNPE